jgi:Pyruvate/2-oxoacid:ferredoxin oxidoreductase delta subunit
MGKEGYEKIAQELNVQPTPLMLEILEMIADPQEVELLLALPGTVDQIADKVRRLKADTEAQCQLLYKKGLALKSFKEGSLGYRMHRDITMFRDATAHWTEAPRAYHDLWKRFMNEEWPEYTRRESRLAPKARGRAIPRGRIIPIERAIDPGRQQILDAESVSAIIEKAERLTVTDCICRVIERNCDMPLETCIQVNNSARYMSDRGIGRQVSKEEALQILQRCEEAGLVHMTLNRSSVDHFICNCCECCCVTLPMVIKEGLNLCDPSRYRAEIDPGLCTACETCLDRCCFGAIERDEGDPDAPVMRVSGQKCMGCGLCHSTCPAEAIRLVAVREKTFIP